MYRAVAASSRSVRLVRPSVGRQTSFRAVLRELATAGERSYHYGPFAVARQDLGRYVELLDVLRRRPEDEHYSPVHGYFLESHDEIVGEVRLRKRLPRELLEIGGHIQLYVRPSMRRRGLGTEALRAALEEARQLRIITLLLAAGANNVAAVSMMTKTKGVPLPALPTPQGELRRFRYILPR